MPKSALNPSMLAFARTLAKFPLVLPDSCQKANPPSPSVQDVHCSRTSTFRSNAHTTDKVDTSTCGGLPIRSLIIKSYARHPGPYVCLGEHNHWLTYIQMASPHPIFWLFLIDCDSGMWFPAHPLWSGVACQSGIQVQSLRQCVWVRLWVQVCMWLRVPCSGALETSPSQGWTELDVFLCTDNFIQFLREYICSLPADLRCLWKLIQ